VARGLSWLMPSARAAALAGGAAVLGVQGMGCGGLLDGEKPPQITALAPVEARSGDTIMLKGSGFAPTAEENAVLIGDRRGRIVTAARDSLSVEVPAVTFLGDGVTRVGVRVRVGERESNSFPLDLHSPRVAGRPPPSTPPEPLPEPTVMTEPTPVPRGRHPASTRAPTRRAAGTRPAPPPVVPSAVEPTLPEEPEQGVAQGLEPDDAAARDAARARAPSSRALVAGDTMVRSRAASSSGPAGFDMGGVQLKQATLEGRVQFEASPEALQADVAFNVKVFLENLADEPLRLKELRTSTVVDGRRSTKTLKLGSEVGPRTRALLAELPGLWSGDTQSWELDVQVVTREGDVYSNRLTWK